MRFRLFEWIGHITSRRPWAVIAFFAAVTIVLGGLAATLHFDMTFFGMLDQDDPEVKLFLNAAENFGELANQIMVVKPPDAETGRKFVAEITAVLENNEYVQTVESHAPIDFLRKNALWLVPDSDAENMVRIIDLLEKEPTPGVLVAKIVEMVEEQGGAMNGFSSSAARDETLPEIFATFLKGENAELPDKILPAGSELLEGDGSYATPDGSMMLVMVRTKTAGLETTLGGPVFQSVLDDVEKVQEKYSGLQTAFTGINAIGYQDQNGVLKRFKILSPVSFIMMLVIFYYFTRIPASPLMVGVSLGAAVVWTFGLVRLTIRYVSLTTLVFGVFLFGLGVDFSIHLIMRYTEERSAGAGPGDALRRAISRTGPGILTGGLTTAAAFFMMVFSDFKGGEQMGLTTAMGMVCSLVAGLVLFPATVAIWSKRREKAVYSSPYSSLKALDSWAAFVVKRPVKILAACVLFTVIVVPFYRNFQLEYDLDRMIYRDIPALDVKKEVEDKFQLSTDFGIAFAGSVEDARDKSIALMKLPSVKHVESIANYLPSATPSKQQLVNRLRKFKPAERSASGATPDVEVFVASLPDDVVRHNEEVKEVVSLIGNIGKEEASRKIMLFENQLRSELVALVSTARLLAVTASPPNVGLEDLPQSIRDRYVAADGSFPVVIYPRKNIFREENIIEFKNEIRRVVPDATGLMVITEMMTKSGIERMPLVCALVLIAMGVIVYSDFRNLRDVALALAPVSVALVWTLGLLCVFRPMMTLFIGISFPLVLGIGVDDGVHMMHRLRSEGSRGVVDAVRTTGRPIYMTTLTTVAGFGILMLMNHNGLFGMGAAITVGVIMCFITTVTVLPALYTLFEKRK